MKALLLAALSAALFAASGCGGSEEKPRPPRPVPAAAQPAAQASAPPPFDFSPTPPADNLCRAQELQSHVGQPLASLPPVPEGATRRTVCRDCAMTMDLRPDRQTVVYDENDVILSIACN